LSRGASPLKFFWAQWVAAGASFICAVLAGLNPAHADQSLEWAVKAAYLTKFPDFVNWPPSAFSGPTAPFVLCIAGGDPFGQLIDRAAGNQRIGDRPVQILRPTAPAQFAHCNMIYVAGDPQFVAVTLQAVRDLPVLTVTDSGRDEPSKGVINFVIRDNHVRFAIDRGAASRDGLEVSSKLLSIAVSDSN
jgi:hypothetical protein